MIYKFEKDTDIDVVTGAILIQPELIEKYPLGLPRLLRKVEFMEYAQAFLAGRNYAAEFDAIYTLSGAFSAFRKSAVLKSRMYNPDTITEDTEITFQMKYQFNKKVHICEDALFFVDPIENLNKLYTQRQRWQRGSLEVSNMFLKDKMKPQYMFFNSAVRTLLYDHTFAFPRLIWYLALLCLCFMNYGFTMIVFSTAILFVLYIVVGFFYYFSTIGYLKHFPDIRSYYRKQWYAVFFLPFFNFVVFFIRFAGVINSINVDSSWKTKNFTEEKQTFRETVEKDFATVNGILEKIRNYVNVE
jgi:putative glycosyltransferase (exosortase G-associated)